MPLSPKGESLSLATTCHFQLASRHCVLLQNIPTKTDMLLSTKGMSLYEKVGYTRIKYITIYVRNQIIYRVIFFFGRNVKHVTRQVFRLSAAPLKDKFSVSFFEPRYNFAGVAVKLKLLNIGGDEDYKNQVISGRHRLKNLL